MQVEEVNDQLGKLSNKQSRDTEARPSRCRAADAELLSNIYNVNKLQVTTVCARYRNRFLMKRLNNLMDISINISVFWETGYD